MPKHPHLLACAILLATQAHAATITPAQPADRPPIEYPATAGTAAGQVTLSFTIGTDGHVHNVAVLQSNPPGLFDAAAIAGVSQWTYHPRLVGTRPADQPNTKVNIAFQPPPPDALVPIFRLPVTYSREAYEQKREGTVTVGYDISPIGLPTNVHVIHANPPGILDRDAIGNVRDWRFPVPEGSQPILNQSTEIVFSLKNALVRPIPDKPVRVHYPPVAYDLGVFGDCSVSFWIEEDGTTSFPKIRTCSPSGYFENEALRVVSEITYKPEADPVLNRRRLHVLNLSFRFRDVFPSKRHDLKTGQWLKLQYTLTSTGHARNIVVLDKSDPSIDPRYMIANLQNTTLSPGEKDGQPADLPNQIIIIHGPTPP